MLAVRLFPGLRAPDQDSGPGAVVGSAVLDRQRLRFLGGDQSGRVVRAELLEHREVDRRQRLMKWLAHVAGVLQRVDTTVERGARVAEDPEPMGLPGTYMGLGVPAVRFL